MNRFSPKMESFVTPHDLESSDLKREKCSESDCEVTSCTKYIDNYSEYYSEY